MAERIMQGLIGGGDGGGIRRGRLLGALAGLAGAVLVATSPAAVAGASQTHAGTASLRAIAATASRPTPARSLIDARDSTGAHAATTGQNCTFNGDPDVVFNVSPGEQIHVQCTGFPANDPMVAAEFSPLYLQSFSSNDIEPILTTFGSDSQGVIDSTITLPNPFAVPDPAAVCPPTAAQVAQGFVACGLVISDLSGTNGALAALTYTGQALPTPPPGTTAVGIAPTSDGRGYWIAWSDGTVTLHGDAAGYGDASGLNLNQPIAHIVATADGKGYWLVAADGGTFAFGDAGFYGSMGGQRLNQPVVDLAPTPDGRGYWLVASDGGIFAFGDAAFWGSMGGQPLNQPVVGIAADRATGGYWLVATDGGIFAFHAPFYGSTGALALNQPVNGMAVTADDGGYLFVASDGGIFCFGDAPFKGSAGGLVLNSPITGVAMDPAGPGYWLVAGDGGVFAFGSAPFLGAV